MVTGIRAVLQAVMSSGVCFPDRRPTERFALILSSLVVSHFTLAEYAILKALCISEFCLTQFLILYSYSFHVLLRHLSYSSALGFSSCLNFIILYTIGITL
jgi:hypothetical protein